MLLARRCVYHPNLRCYRSSCDIFVCSTGNVEVCSWHLNPFGRFMRRLSKPMVVSLFSKHRKGGS